MLRFKRLLAFGIALAAALAQLASCSAMLWLGFPLECQPAAKLAACRFALHSRAEVALQLRHAFACIKAESLCSSALLILIHFVQAAASLQSAACLLQPSLRQAQLCFLLALLALLRACCAALSFLSGKTALLACNFADSCVESAAFAALRFAQIANSLCSFALLAACRCAKLNL